MTGGATIAAEAEDDSASGAGLLDDIPRGQSLLENSGVSETTRSAVPFDVAFKSVFGINFYPESVKVLAERIYPEEKVKAAYCVGPVVHQATWMPVVYCATACLVGGTTAVLSNCDEGEGLKWPSWLWYPWLLVGLTLLAAEYRILKHLSVPHYFKAGGWKAMPADMLASAFKMMNGGTACDCWTQFTTDWGFVMWMTWNLFLSSVRLVSFFSANMFVGMVLGDSWLKANDCSAGNVERIWRHSLEKSRWWLLSPETTLSSVFVFMLAAQIAHFLLGVLHAWPRPGQWYKNKGLKPVHKRHPGCSDRYEQDIELDVIEFVPWKAPPDVKEERQRPDGTRFSYVNLLGTEVTTSVAVETCAEACGQASIEKTTELVFCAQDNKVVSAIAKAEPEKRPDPIHIRQVIVEMRAMIQDALGVLRTVLSHVFLYGVCFSGLVLQAQVTYYHARCFNNGEMECEDTAGLVVGVVAGFLTVGITLFKATRILLFIWQVHCVKDQYATWVANTPSIHDDDADRELKLKHGHVLESQKWLAAYACLVCLAVLLFVVNFAWVATKYYMAEFVCKDHIWDVAFPLKQGCVHIDHKTLFS